MTDILIGILEQGFIYGILALGVYITYTILDFPDLSVDGTFPMGAAAVSYTHLNLQPATDTVRLEYGRGEWNS